jgi:hypothetical protein
MAGALGIRAILHQHCCCCCCSVAVTTQDSDDIRYMAGALKALGIKTILHQTLLLLLLPHRTAMTSATWQAR